MDAARLLELENIFIMLKNEGKSFEQIAKRLPSVSKIRLKKWEKNYTDAVNKFNASIPNGIRGLIVSKDVDQKYRSNVFSNFTQLDKIRLELRTIRFDDPNLETKKQTSLEVFSEYFETVEMSRFEMSYLLKKYDALVIKKAAEAFDFYVEYVLNPKIKLKNKSRITQTTLINAYSFENILPYGIKQLKVENFQGIKNTSIENLHIDAKWIFLTGENSFGKTTILQAIALALTGEKRRELKDEIFAIEFQSKVDSIILNYWDWFTFTPFKHLACYGASRLMLQTERSQNIEGAKSTTTYSLFNNDGLLLNIEYDLFKWFYKKDARFETVINIFKKLIPNIQDIVLDEKDDTIYYIEKDGINRLTFNQLGSGYRSLIGMVGDMMIRLFKTQPEITKPSDLAGIVLIDELDLHWHPKWQRRLPTLLSEIFPKVQFIASTHSEMPLLGAPENSIFLKVTRTLEEGVKVQKLDINLSNLLPHHLLTSALFDMDFNDITSVTHKHTQDLRTEDTMQEIEDTDKIRERLKNYKANNAKFPKDLFK